METYHLRCYNIYHSFIICKHKKQKKAHFCSFAFVFLISYITLRVYKNTPAVFCRSIRITGCFYLSDFLFSAAFSSGLKVGIFLIVVMTCSGEMSFVHSKWRSVPLWRGHQRKSKWSKSRRISFQQLWQV